MTETKPSAKEPKDAVKFTVVSPSGVNVRRHDSLTSDVVRKVETGEVISAQSVGVDWVKVEDGYIYNRDYTLKKK